MQIPAVSAMCVTPFDEAGLLDEAALRKLVRFLAESSVGIYLGSYGTGEGHLLRRAEIRRLYEVGVDEAGGRVPVLAAALGFQSTEEVLELAAEALATGVSAVQIHPPRPGPLAIRPRDELEEFYREVLPAVEGPVALSNQVVMVGYALPLDLLSEVVASHGNVVALNTSDPDLGSLQRVVGAAAPVPVYVGVISQLVSALALGAAGALCFEADLLPGLCLAVCDAYRAGDTMRLETSFDLLLRLNAVLSLYQNPRSVKAGMTHLGLLSCGRLRRPYLELLAAEQAEIAGVIDEVVAAFG